MIALVVGVVGLALVAVVWRVVQLRRDVHDTVTRGWFEDHERGRRG